MTEKGAMTAIVLDHEQPHEKPGSRYSQRQRKPPVTEMQDCPGQHPQRCQWHERNCNFYHATDLIGGAVPRKDLCPSWSVGRQDRQSSGSEVFQFRVREKITPASQPAKASLNVAFVCPKAAKMQTVAYWPNGYRERISLIGPSRNLPRCSDMSEIEGQAEVAREVSVARSKCCAY